MGGPRWNGPPFLFTIIRPRSGGATGMQCRAEPGVEEGVTGVAEVADHESRCKGSDTVRHGVKVRGETG
jgi:hypothetical protein